MIMEKKICVSVSFFQIVRKIKKFTVPVTATVTLRPLHPATATVTATATAFQNLGSM